MAEHFVFGMSRAIDFCVIIRLLIITRQRDLTRPSSATARESELLQHDNRFIKSNLGFTAASGWLQRFVRRNCYHDIVGY